MWANYIKSDLCRYVGEDNLNYKSFLKEYFLNTGFKFSVWLRIAKFSHSPILKTVARFQHLRFKQKYLLDISIKADIGYGLYLGHGGGIMVNRTAKLGNNVNLSPFTTIGSNHENAAEIGDNVYIGPNVSIVEDVKIGDNVTIGAGAVVTRDVPNSATAAGVPVKVLKIDDTPNEYVINRWQSHH